MFAILVIFVITLSVVSTVCDGEVTKNEWVQPDAFSRQKSKQTITSSSINDLQLIESVEECDACPVCPEFTVEPESPQICMKPEDEDIATVLYKRLVTSLIIKDNVPSKSSTKILKLTVTEKQLRILKSSTNIRDWDGVMSEIIASLHRIDPETNYVYRAQGYWVFDNLNLSYVASFLSMSEVRFTLGIILCLLLGVYLRKKYRWGIIYMFFVALFSFGYLYTYYECNRQLEVDDLVNMMQTQYNPCQEVEKPQSYFTSLFKIFSDPKEECERYLR